MGSRDPALGVRLRAASGRPLMRAILVTNIPTPYRAPLYAAIHRHLAERGGGFTVIYGGWTEPGRQWPDDRPPTGGVPSVFLRRGQARLLGRTTYVNPGVVRTLRRTRPDVVVMAGYAPWTYAIALWCRGAGIPYVLWSGETADRARTQGGERRGRRRPLWAGASGYIAYGP